MDLQEEYELRGTITPKQQPEPEKKAFFSRLMDKLGVQDNTARATAKMLIVFVFVFAFTIGVDMLSTLAFGEDTVGNEFSIGLGFVGSLLLSRLAWIYEY